MTTDFNSIWNYGANGFHWMGSSEDLTEDVGKLFLDSPLSH